MKRSILIAAATALTLGLLYAANSFASPTPIVTIRTAAVDTAELDRLIEVFEGHSETDPASRYIQSELGALYLTRARTVGSIDDYTLAIEVLDPLSDGTDPAASIRLAQARLAVHDFAGALETITSLTDTEATPASFDSLEFDAYVGVGDFDSATNALARLMRAHPDEPAILIRQAELAWLTGDSATALASSRQALDIADGADLGAADMTFYLTARARYLVSAGDYGAAARLTSRALEIDPSNPATLLISAKAAAALGDISKATDLAEAAAERAPEPATLAFLADLRLAGGDTLGAETELDTIEAIASLGQTASRRAVAQSLAEHGRALDVALEAANRELTERSDPYAHHLMATVLWAVGSSAEAEEHFLIASSVDDPLIWYRGGLIALANGETEIAIERLEYALDLSPNFHPIHAGDASARLEGLES